MISTKHQMVTSNVLRRLGMAALIAAAWVIGFELLLYIVGLIFDHNLTSFMVSLRGIPQTLGAILNIVLFLYFLLTPYVDFKWSIQNGISRKTLWQGRLLALLFSTILIYLVDELLALTAHPLLSWHELVINFLALLTGVVTFQAIGNGFGLLPRKWKVIVGIGIPIIFMILCVGLIKLMLSIDTGGLVLGYQHNHYVGSLAWLFNSLNPTITLWVLWLIYFIVVLWLTKLFNDHLQLRRD